MKKYINKYVAVLVLLTTLTACKVSKDVETPKDALPENFRNTTSTDTTSIADQSWKEFFTEPSLQKLIDSAIVRNNDLLVAQKNIEAAQWQLTQSKWGNVPKVNFQATATSTRLSDNSLNGLSTSTFLRRKHVEDYNAALNLSWEADIWGKIRNQKRSALAEYLQSAEAKKALQTTIVANVSKGFYNLLMLDAQLEIAKKNLTLNDSTLFVINLQYESGQVTSLAKQQAEAQQSVAAQLIPELEQNIAIQENALSTITGTFPSAKERKTTLGAIALKENAAAGIPSSLVSRRPDVKNAELALKAANAKVGIAKASLYPTLNITAAGGLTSFEASNWFNTPASLFGTVAGSLAQPLLNGKRLKAQYEISKIEREKAVINFRQSVLVAVGEVSDALVKVEKLKEQQAIVAGRVATLQKAVKNADMLFKNGMATYLEVIVAQGNLLQSELDLASIKRSSLEADVELYRSLGGGWK
ncbi:NodT family efflux transporter outer membrane factor (OMF) lipoprotein [Flavobacterium gossypii]|uniref:NodT family efflux transporter outer membrane factor (OMF) lipoprotein n=2 Tax=Flavobacterium TaxID=237 RepID=A0A495MDF8_9FLAO|nr:MULTISPECIES: efflux transporter outer membrane subunit [Flavobacterium]MBA9074191.1 NodT family efflux transporter outer membrane factor (OMF) lipoprotein [Flavobacterium gossypii]RKS23390.1 NodT family efflux transporter outer membrane factor (OMF) lipoprotein [Flavobacterium endophyticum]